MHILIPSMNSGIYTPKLVRELIYKSGCAHDHSHDALHDYIINLHTPPQTRKPSKSLKCLTLNGCNAFRSMSATSGKK